MIMKHLRLILILAFALVTVSCGKFNTNKKLHAVDLGLSVKWANMNVGALKPEASGLYFAWGEVEPKETYTEDNYKWSTDSYTSLTKYNIHSPGTVDNLATLAPEDDAAHVRLGGKWRIPTVAECNELCTECDWEVIEQNGIKGVKVTGRKEGYTGNSIFIPFSGGFSDELNGDGEAMWCWTSSLHEWEYSQDSKYAYVLLCHRDSQPVIPMNGEFLDLECSPSSVTIHFSSGSIRTMSATPPACRRPQGSL